LDWANNHFGQAELCQPFRKSCQAVLKSTRIPHTSKKNMLKMVAAKVKLIQQQAQWLKVKEKVFLYNLLKRGV